MDASGDSSLVRVQDQVIEEMSGLENPLARYRYLVGLGQELQSPEGIRSDQHTVPGCQFQVWIRAEVEDGRLRLFADSDAMISRGIIALLLRVLDDQPPSAVADADLYFLEKTGLATQLSPSRANGLAAMVERIRQCAREVMDAGGASAGG